MNNNPIILKIKNAIIGTEFENNTYIAGGFVRDMVMKKQSNDIDIVVSNNGLSGGINLSYLLYNTLNTSSPVTFPRFGTAQIVIDNIDVEIVATRKESYNFIDRNPIVSEGTINDDVMRRDFTINALLYDISNDKIIDLVNGIEDIKNGIIRTTGKPDEIFAEDPLRILRAIRFHSQLGFKIEYKTKRQIILKYKWLKNISNERIRDEFNKILISSNVKLGLTLLKETKILEYIIPEFKQLYNIKYQGRHHIKDAWNHTLDVVGNITSTIEHRLAALLHDIGKGKTMTIEDNDVHFYQHQFISRQIANKFMINYKYSNNQINLICKSIELHMNFIDNMLNKTIRKIVNEVGKDTFEFCLDLAEADSKREERKNIVNSIRKFINSDEFIIKPSISLPVNGDIIMKRYNIKPSKRVGDLLKVEQEYLFEFPEATKDEIISILDKEMVNENYH